MYFFRGIKIDHKEAYRAALKHLLDKKGRGAQTSIAIEAGISQPQLNKIKEGLQTGSVDGLHAIAYALNSTYEEMLAIGRQIIKGEPPIPSKESKIPISIDLLCSKLKILDEHDLRLIDELIERFLKTH